MYWFVVPVNWLFDRWLHKLFENENLHMYCRPKKINFYFSSQTCYHNISKHVTLFWVRLNPKECMRGSKWDRITFPRGATYDYKILYLIIPPQRLKNFMDPLKVVKKHRVLKIGVFRPLFCLGMLGKSTSYNTGTQPLSSCFWAK